MLGFVTYQIPKNIGFDKHTSACFSVPLLLLTEIPTRYSKWKTDHASQEMVGFSVYDKNTVVGFSIVNRVKFGRFFEW